MPKSEPVTESEVTEVVLRALSTAFGDRPLTQDVARRGLRMAQFRFIELELAEKAKRGGG
jgi:hypothetical protein